MTSTVEPMRITVLYFAALREQSGKEQEIRLTHAPDVATLYAELAAEAWLVSIRAPAWGATLRIATVADIDWVSIRAPAWGATRHLSVRTARRLFQFALPRGERPASACSSAPPAGFNSRSRVGSDPVMPHLPCLCKCFNSRSRVGSDLRRQCARRWHPRFNSRSRVGSDHTARDDDQNGGSFNSRSRVGSDPAWLVFPRVSVCFNSRSRVGSDYWPRYKCCKIRVSIRAPAWGATAGDCRC